MTPNGGVIEETGKATREFIGALRKEWPLSLALVLMNICLLVFCYIILRTVADQREREVALLYADHKEVRDLLSRCIVPERRTDVPDKYPHKSIE